MLRVQRRPAGFELDAARGGQRPREVQDPLNRVPHADRLGRQRQLAGLDPRDVEDLVDEGQEVSPPLGDLLDTLAIRRPFDFELQELGESENRVERGPELVAHPGEELALGPIRTIGESGDRKSTRLNSSHGYISYAVFCLKKKKNNINI